MNGQNGQDGFIGMGHNPNPNVPDIPLGLGMALFQEAEARSYFESLSDAQKSSVIHYVHDNNATGDEVEAKIERVIEGLKHSSLQFIKSSSSARLHT